MVLLGEMARRVRAQQSNERSYRLGSTTTQYQRQNDKRIDLRRLGGMGLHMYLHRTSARNADEMPTKHNNNNNNAIIITILCIVNEPTAQSAHKTNGHSVHISDLGNRVWVRSTHGEFVFYVCMCFGSGTHSRKVVLTKQQFFSATMATYLRNASI